MEAAVMEEEWGTWPTEVGNTASFAKLGSATERLEAFLA